MAEREDEVAAADRAPGERVSSASDALAPDPARRLLIAGTCALGGAVAAGVIVPAARMLLYPRTARVVVTATEPIDIGAAAAVPADGRAVKLAVVAPTVRDAWTAKTNVPLGAAFVRRDQAGNLVALSSICPHLGCAVALAADEKQFVCPCHDSSFALTGERQAGPAERDLDPLPIEEVGGRLKLTWRQYRIGGSTREPA